MLGQRPIGPISHGRRLKARLIDAAARLGPHARLDRLEAKIDRLEFFSNGNRATYVGNNKVLVKAVIGGHNLAYFVEADDKLLSPWFIITGIYDEELTRYFLRELNHDSHCLDVGSNFGYFVCMMARFCPRGRVIGIEADHKVFELARDNVHINNFSDVASVIHAAASNSSDEIMLYRRTMRSGNTSIVAVGQDLTDFLGEPPATPFAVKGIRIDDLADQFNGRLDFMKIDVEGAEPLVFDGAREIIRHNKQISIVMEWSPGQIQSAGFKIAEFLDVLKDIGLGAFDFHKRKLVPISFQDLANLPYRSGIVLKPVRS